MLEHLDKTVISLEMLYIPFSRTVALLTARLTLQRLTKPLPFKTGYITSRD